MKVDSDSRNGEFTRARTMNWHTPAAKRLTKPFTPFSKQKTTTYFGRPTEPVKKARVQIFDQESQ